MNVRTLVETLVLPFVQRPMRYVGGETNSIVKDPDTVELKGVLCFPDLYDIGMSHHGSQILYHIVNRHPRWSLSRAFHPWTDAEQIMRREQLPLWDLEYFEPIGSADWVGFSVQYELQYTNILNMLDLANIALRTVDRDKSDGPIIIGGGPCLINPEPLAPFFDALVIGDGERAIEQICASLAADKARGVARSQMVRNLATLDGVYVPGLVPVSQQGRFLCANPGTSVKAARIADLDPNNYPVAPVVPLAEVVHHRLAVEVMRGCTRGCRFCAAGMYYRPLRERGVDDLSGQIRDGLCATGFRDVGLLSLSSADYSELDNLLKAVQSVRTQAQVRVSLPSTRLDALTDDQLRAINETVGASSFTIAPEAGSERLRAVINKGFTDQEIVGAVDRLAAHGIQTIKLYFMVGLPTETNEDIDAIVRLVEQVAARARGMRGRIRINVAISPFSPKAHTPFAWEALESAAELTEKGKWIKRELAPVKNVSVSYRDGAITVLETIAARGDRRVADLVEAAWRLGARMDGWDEFFDYGRWETAAEQIGLTLSTYTESIDESQVLPWAVSQIGVTGAFLLDERHRAYKGEPTADCRDGECSTCGACTSVGPRFAQIAQIPVESAAVVVKAVSAPPVWYRIIYSKTGRIRFLGHRDMTGVFERTIVSAGVHVVYSQGFSPHPRLAFGPPLALGVAGLREGFDAQLQESDTTFLARVNRLLPEGLVLLEGAAHAVRPRAITDALCGAHYRFRLLFPEHMEKCRRALATFQNQREVLVRREKKGEVREINIRPLVDNIDIGTGDTFTAWLDAAPASTCSPALFIDSLGEGLNAGMFEMTRLHCLIAQGQTTVPM